MKRIVIKHCIDKDNLYHYLIGICLLVLALLFYLSS